MLTEETRDTYLIGHSSCNRHVTVMYFKDNEYNADIVDNAVDIGIMAIVDTYIKGGFHVTDM